MPEQKDNEVDLEEAVANIIRKNKGSANRAVETLLEENFKFRSDRRKAREDLKALQEKYPEGTVALTPDEAKIWNTIKPVLDKEKLDTPEKVEKKLAEPEELRAQIAERDRDILIGEIHELTGFPKGTLRDMVAARKLTPAIEEVEVEVEENGQKVKRKEKRAVLTTAEKDAKPMEFAEYITTNAAEYEPLLGSEQPTTTVVAPTGKKVLGQTSSKSTKGGTKGSSSILDAHLEKQKTAAERPNPLKSGPPKVAAPATK